MLGMVVSITIQFQKKIIQTKTIRYHTRYTKKNKHGNIRKILQKLPIGITTKKQITMQTSLLLDLTSSTIVAEEFQLTEELTALAKTKSSRQRQIHYNPNWQYLKEKAKETLQSKDGKRIYGCRKTDVEPIFGHMKSVFGMRRTHLRGKKEVETEIGIMFMMMNLSKYGAKRKVKPLNYYSKKQKTEKFTAKMNFSVLLSGIKAQFFSDTF